MRQEPPNARHEAQRGPARFAVAGLSPRVVDDLCDAIEFGVHGVEPTAAEYSVLRRSLRVLAREAHGSGMQPEQLLLALRRIWWEVCRRDPSPDMHDRCWDLVVREALDAYEAERPRPQ